MLSGEKNSVTSNKRNIYPYFPKFSETLQNCYNLSKTAFKDVIPSNSTSRKEIRCAFDI